MPPCNWVCAEIKGFIEWAVNSFQGVLIDATNWVLQKILEPIIQTPAIKGQNKWIAFEGAANQPWDTLYSEMYLTVILPLATAAVFIGAAYVGLRIGAVRPSEYKRKKMLRRVPIAFGAILFWWPVASMATRLANQSALFIAGTCSACSGGVGGSGGAPGLVQTIGDVFVAWAGALGSTFLSITILGFDLFALIIALGLIATRWLLIILLTISMPLLAAVWVYEVWPLNRFAGIARNLASVYPGLLIGGVLAAALLRFVFEMNLQAFDFFNGVLKAFMLAIVFPLAAFIPILTAFGGNRVVQYQALRMATSGVGAAAGASAGAAAGSNGPQSARELHQKLLESPKRVAGASKRAVTNTVKAPGKIASKGVQTTTKYGAKAGVKTAKSASKGGPLTYPQRKAINVTKRGATAAYSTASSAGNPVAKGVDAGVRDELGDREEKVYQVGKKTAKLAHPKAQGRWAKETAYWATENPGQAVDVGTEAYRAYKGDGNPARAAKKGVRAAKQITRRDVAEQSRRSRMQAARNEQGDNQ